LILVLGPTAAGKTTFSRTLCKRFSKRGRGCFFTVSEPFGGPAYILLTVLSLITRYMYGNVRLLFSLKKPAQLENANPRLLGKLLPLLILLDFLSIVLRYIIFRVVEKAGFIVVVEDGIIQALLDHMYMVKRYARSNKWAMHIIKLESKIFYKIIINKYNICIVLYTNKQKRTKRAKERRDTPIFAVGFYNEVIRLSLPLYLCKLINNKITYISLEI